MRFYNIHGDTDTIKKVHVAFAEKYNQLCDTKQFGICHKSTVMLEMLDFLYTSFNAYLSIEDEKVINNKWEVRQAHFEKMGVRFCTVFANVRNTKSGSKYKAVISIFGMSICHWFVFFPIL